MYSDRRNWIKQTTMLVGAIGLGDNLFAKQKNIFKPESNQILLNSNENPYGPSPLARQAILDHYLSSNRYPDSAISDLKKKLAAQWSVKDENILMGAGSSEIIGLALLIAANWQRYIVADPAYSFWQKQAETFGYKNITKVPLDKDKKYDLPKMQVHSKSIGPAFIYICNPNNPTGTFIDQDNIKKFVEDEQRLSFESNTVFIDEAYTEYADLPSLASWAVNKPNVIVAKTFSKIYGLAGARVGYAIAHPSMIKRLAALQPWPDANLSAASIAAASASLDDKDFVKDCKQKTAASKELCYNTFKELKLDYIPSSANFILFNIDKIKKDLTKEMEARNIYVQHREHFGGKWCRVTMGTENEMQAFTKSLKEIMT
ncbi:MAG: histidinol-phosphate transaminase [Chitinophagaceae bacterium]